MSDENPGTEVEVSTGGKRTKEWWDAHPEEREKQRQRALQQVAEGKISGRAGYGRRKRRPAYEVAAFKAGVNATKIAEQLIKQALNVGEDGEPGTGMVTVAQQQKAIEILFEQEQRVRSERRNDEDHLARMAGDELTLELFRMIREVTGVDEFDDYIEGDAVEETDLERDGTTSQIS